MGDISIGQVSIPFDDALQWIREYTDPVRSTSKNPFAYPAYDALDTGSDVNHLNDGDLLACTLLNVRLSASAFYRFQSMRSDLQAGLASHHDAPLVDLDSAEITAKVRALYDVLDADRAEHGTRGQSGTTLSKILHRKHPESLPLHDKWVRQCYLGTEAVPRVRTRSWADYMVLVTVGMKDDLLRHRSEFHALRNAVQGPSHLTDLRLLDILAWTSKGASRPV